MGFDSENEGTEVKELEKAWKRMMSFIQEKSKACRAEIEKFKVSKNVSVELIANNRRVRDLLFEALLHPEQLSQALAPFPSEEAKEKGRKEKFRYVA